MRSVKIPELEEAILAPREIRSGVPSFLITYQLVAEICTVPTQSLLKQYTTAIAIALRWLAGRSPHDIPKEAWDGESFNLEIPGRSVACVSVIERNIWAAQLTHPDLSINDKPAVPGRSWRADIAFQMHPTKVCFGIKITSVSHQHSTEGIVLTRPRLVLDLAREVGLKEIRPIDGKPWALAIEEDLDELYTLLQHPRRTMPVFLLTQPDKRKKHLPGRISDFLLEPNYLALGTQGMAHVVTMPMDLGFKWTDKVGKIWSAFLGAVRTYYPGLSFEESSPFTHPLVFAENIVLWRYNNKQAEIAYTEHLYHQAQFHTVSKHAPWDEVTFLTDARALLAEIERKKHREDKDMHQLYEEEIAALNAKIQKHNDDMANSERDLAEVKRERDRHKEEAAALRRYSESLRHQHIAKGEIADTQVRIPDSYDELPGWAKENLIGRLELLPRRFEARRKRYTRKLLWSTNPFCC